MDRARRKPISRERNIQGNEAPLPLNISLLNLQRKYEEIFSTQTLAIGYEVWSVTSFSFSSLIHQSFCSWKLTFRDEAGRENNVPAIYPLKEHNFSLPFEQKSGKCESISIRSSVPFRPWSNWLDTRGTPVGFHQEELKIDVAGLLFPYSLVFPMLFHKSHKKQRSFHCCTARLHWFSVSSSSWSTTVNELNSTTKSIDVI